MRLLLSIDVDDGEKLDYCLVDMCNKTYKKRIKERIVLYLKNMEKNPDLVGLSFGDNNSPVHFYTGGQKLNTNLYVISSLVIQKAKPVLEGDLLNGVFEIDDCSGEVTPSYPMVDIENVISDEGFFFKAFHVNSGDLVITAPIPVELVAKKLGLEVP